MQAAHIAELRSALTTARSGLTLPAAGYSRLTLTQGSTSISAADVGELRSGTQ